MTTINLFHHASDTFPVAKDEVLFREGDAGDGMYAVVSGEIDIIIHGKLIETVTAGGIVGEMALIDHKPRSATVQARSDSQLVKIDEKRFQFLVQETPFFALQVMRILVERIRRIHAAGIELPA